MRLSVVSVVSFQGLFGVEVRTYKVLTKNTSQPQDAGKIFRQTERLDLVRPWRPRKHLRTCNVTTPRYDGKTAKMEVNELLGRFEKVRIVLAWDKRNKI